jgi:phospholipid-binding lipoprotein MlaA
MHTIAEIDDQPLAAVADPWERFNRSIYLFNYYLDEYLLLPLVHGYEFVTPGFVQARVSAFFQNLGDIRNATNSLFQLKGTELATTVARFVTNSTVGLGGLFDPATHLGLERHDQDFGLTLAYWGANFGPYLVLPILGPSSLRDTAGLAVDSGIGYGIYAGIRPFAGAGDRFAMSAGLTGLGGVDARHRESFRYYGSGYPFEYYMVRFFYREKRRLASDRSDGADQ